MTKSSFVQYMPHNASAVSLIDLFTELKFFKNILNYRVDLINQ